MLAEFKTTGIHKKFDLVKFSGEVKSAARPGGIYDCHVAPDWSKPYGSRPTGASERCIQLFLKLMLKTEEYKTKSFVHQLNEERGISSMLADWLQNVTL